MSFGSYIILFTGFSASHWNYFSGEIFVQVKNENIKNFWNYWMMAHTATSRHGVKVVLSTPSTPYPQYTWYPLYLWYTRDLLYPRYIQDPHNVQEFENFNLPPSLSRKIYFAKDCYEIPDRGAVSDFRDIFKGTFAVTCNYFFL